MEFELFCEGCYFYEDCRRKEKVKEEREMIIDALTPLVPMINVLNVGISCPLYEPTVIGGDQNV